MERSKEIICLKIWYNRLTETFTVLAKGQKTYLLSKAFLLGLADENLGSTEAQGFSTVVISCLDQTYI